MRIAFAVFLAASVGCSAPPAMQDAGAPHDAGELDGGDVDGGSFFDGGSPVDGGSPDGGLESDAGNDADAGDGGSESDAGDAGAETDAGSDGGISCAQLLGSLYEAFETRCDGIDNDCNGVVDVSEPRLVAEGPGDIWVSTMGMDIIELTDGTILGAWNRGLQRMTPEFADAGFALVPWTDVSVSGGYIRFHPIRDGHLLRTWGYAGSELRWINADGSPRSLSDGGWKFWANDGGVIIFSAAELSNGDLVVPFRTTGYDPPRALMLIPADGGPTLDGTDAGMLFGDPLPIAGDRILAVEGEWQGGGFVFRPVEFDSSLRKIDAGAWIGPPASNANATVIPLPPPTGVHDARIAISGFTSSAGPQHLRRARSGEDGGEVWLPWSLALFDIAPGPRGNAVISARADSLDSTSVIARLDDGPLVHVSDGGLPDLPHRKFHHIAALADGGFVATFTAEDGGVISQNYDRSRYAYAVRLCLSADGGTP